MEYLAITGLRTDGRLPTEHRRINIELGVHAQSDGSAMFELGQTKVWASCQGPRESSTTTYGVTVEIVSAPFSTMERKKPRNDNKRLRDLSTTLERALNRVVEVNKFPRSRVDLQVRIIQNDGGLPWTVFNCCSLALMDAGVPMTDLCVACGVCFADNSILVDPNASEASSLSGGEFWMSYAPRENKMIASSFTGKITSQTLHEVVKRGEETCRQMCVVINAFVTTHYNSHLNEEVNEEEEEDMMMEEAQ